MTSAAGKWDPRRCLGWVGLAGVLLLALGGCAMGSSQGDAPRDKLTESDEGEVRKRARIRMELAVGYFEQGKTDIALDEVKQVLSSDPNFPDAYTLRGLIYMRLNDMRQAEDSFRRAVALDARDANAQHNYGWLQCQTGRYAEAQRSFEAAMASPGYSGQAKTLLAQGVCQARAGRNEDAERSLARSYELDPANPVTAYNLASLLFRRGENARSQFIVRRLNNSDLANAETLWLGIKIERKQNDMIAARQLGEVLRKRFAQSREAGAFERGAFDE